MREVKTFNLHWSIISEHLNRLQPTNWPPYPKYQRPNNKTHLYLSWVNINKSTNKNHLIPPCSKVYPLMVARSRKSEGCFGLVIKAAAILPLSPAFLTLFICLPFLPLRELDLFVCDFTIRFQGYYRNGTYIRKWPVWN